MKKTWISVLLALCMVLSLAPLGVSAADTSYLLNVVTPYDTPYWYKESDFIDMGGETYSHGFTCMGYGDNPYGNETFFNLNGEYSSLSLIAGIVESSRTKDDVRFMFYTDGELAYQFTMSSTELPKSCTVDVSGCRQLKIAVYDQYRVANGSGTYGLAEIKIVKDKSATPIEGEPEKLKDGQVYFLNEVAPYEKPYWYRDNDIIRMGGRTYTHGFTCMGYGDDASGNATYFNLKGQYTKLSFKAGIISNNQSKRDVTISFYADGDLIYSFRMERNALPTSHTIDLTGCKQLAITVYDGYWVADGSGTYGLADMVLTKLNVTPTATPKPMATPAPIVTPKPTVTPTPKPSAGFEDVDPTVWYAQPVEWAVEFGITTGTSSTTFSPNANCTRAQIVTFLWRAAGQPKVSGSNPFKDVKSSDYFYRAVLWAVSEGITSGTSATTFSPNNSCTRAQAFTFLWRSAAEPITRTNVNPFRDVRSGTFYYSAVMWAVEQEITTGTSETTFSPENVCTRAQIVSMMYRYYHS